MPCIAYSNTMHPALKYAAKDQTGWHIEDVDRQHDEGLPSLVLDSSGLPHISYSGGSGQGILYARNTGGSWILETIRGGTLIFYSSIALAADGPCVSYTIAEVGSDWLKYSYRGATGWTLKDLNRPSLTQEIISSLALDSQDVSHVVYTELNSNELWHVSGRNGYEWTYGKIISDGWLGSSSALRCDSAGHLHLCYLEGPTVDDSLFYAYRDDSGWHHETVDDPPCSGAGIALDPSGMPCILYFKYSDLMYAYKDGAGWHIENVTEGSTQYVLYGVTSLAVDSSGRPHVTANGQWDFVYGKRWVGLALDCGEPSAWGKGIKVDVNWSFRGVAGTVDVYLAVKLPSGALLFLDPKMNAQTKVVPVARGMQVSGDMRGALALAVGSKPPNGDYTFMAVCVPAGSPVTNFANHLGDGINEDVVDVH
jgi:hypothetical protein